MVQGTTNRLRPFEVAQREMNQLFDTFFGPTNGGAQRAWFAPAALWEEGNSYHVEIDLPGIGRDEVELTLEKNVLSVKAERKLPEGERTYWHNERGYGKVERNITLPDNVDAESIQAQFQDGVLNVTLSKRPEALPKRIEIKS